MLDRLFWAGRLALRRLSAQWRSLLTVIAGTLLSALVGALVPLYTAAVAQVGMVERFNQHPTEDGHYAFSLALVSASSSPPLVEAIPAYDAQARQAVQRDLTAAFPGWPTRTTLFLETTALDINPPAEPGEAGGPPRIPNPTTRAYLAYYEGWPEAVSVLAGRLPTNAPDPDADIEIAIPFEAQNTLGIALNDVLILDQGGPRGGWPTSQNIRARVVGVVNPPDVLSAVDRAYFMPPSPLRFNTLTGDYRAEFAALTTREAVQRAAVDFLPDTQLRFGWRVSFDHARLPFRRLAEARAALTTFDTAIVSTFRDNAALELNLVRHTQLIDWQLAGDQNVDRGILARYGQDARSLDAPFGLLLLQVGALVVFFLMVTAALVRRGERREIALLQSRGAADRAVVLVRGLEAAVLCLLATLSAPFLAQQLLVLIAPFFARYPELPLPLTGEVFAYAGVAAAAAFLALMATLRPVLRLPLITGGGVAGRADKQAWWQRYYLDVVLAVLGIAALLRLVGRETPLFTTSSGGAASDPFLLLAPALLFLGLGSILLRLFPVMAGIAARVLAAGRGLIGALATWQLSREPIHYGRVTFLLALAIGIGWFATSFRATVNRSQNDQAQYRVGTDIRAAERDLRLNVSRARPAEVYTALPGVEAVSFAWRQTAVNYQSDPTKTALIGNLLAVDPTTFGRAVYWRDDLGTLNTPPATAPLPPVGEELPFAPHRLRLWARFDAWTGVNHVPDLARLRRRITLYARLQDAAGTWLIAPFRLVEAEYERTGPLAPGLGGGGEFVTNGWALFEADFSVLNYAPVAPVRMVSLYWRHRSNSRSGERFARLYLTDLTAYDAVGKAEPLDVLRSPNWEFAYDSGALSEGQATPNLTESGRVGVGVMWDQTAETAQLGLLLNYPEAPLVPMIASRSLMDQMGWLPGQTVQVRNLGGLTVTFQLTADVDQRYFPSLYDSYRRDGRWVADRQYAPFAVVERERLLYALNRRPSGMVYPDEVWLKVAPSADIAAILAAARPSDRSAALVNVQTLPGTLETLQTDPLSRGLLGLMFLAFIVSLALSIVGLLTYAALTAAARRAEFGVLRAIGLDAPRLVGGLLLEQLFVVGVASALGAVLGAVLSSQVVPRLAQDASGAQITPPFIVQAESAALAQYGLIIAGVLVIVLGASAALVRGLSLSRTLRLGEE